MNEQFVWNVTYNADYIKRIIESIDDIELKLYAIPHDPLTIEETYKLREALSLIQALNEMTVDDLEVLAEHSPKNRIKKLFRRK